ncbi:hypothetical protein TIFTF001_044286 [Ficus carica]|uniref:Uncharacterized protein n=1 Tax=Ficus carica TaxID=3494 RepID=A0AA87ZC92_FICCA|nr:hypothetical protein TIFTF001_044286 [Ficus carica]
MPRYLPHLNGSDLEARSQGQEKGLHSTLHVDGDSQPRGPRNGPSIWKYSLARTSSLYIFDLVAFSPNKSCNFASKVEILNSPPRGGRRRRKASRANRTAKAKRKSPVCSRIRKAGKRAWTANRFFLTKESAPSLTLHSLFHVHLTSNQSSAFPLKHLKGHCRKNQGTKIMLKARIDALMLRAGAHSPFYCGISPSAPPPANASATFKAKIRYVQLFINYLWYSLIGLISYYMAMSLRLMQSVPSVALLLCTEGDVSIISVHPPFSLWWFFVFIFINVFIPPLFSTKIVIDSCFLFPEGTELALEFRATYPSVSFLASRVVSTEKALALPSGNLGGQLAEPMVDVGWPSPDHRFYRQQREPLDKGSRLWEKIIPLSGFCALQSERENAQRVARIPHKLHLEWLELRHRTWLGKEAVTEQAVTESTAIEPPSVGRRTTGSGSSYLISSDTEGGRHQRSHRSSPRTKVSCFSLSKVFLNPLRKFDSLLPVFSRRYLPGDSSGSGAASFILSYKDVFPKGPAPLSGDNSRRMKREIRFDSSQSLGAGASVQSFLSPEWLGGTASLDLTGSVTFTPMGSPQSCLGEHWQEAGLNQIGFVRNPFYWIAAFSFIFSWYSRLLSSGAPFFRISVSTKGRCPNWKRSLGSAIPGCFYRLLVIQSISIRFPQAIGEESASVSSAYTSSKRCIRGHSPLRFTKYKAQGLYSGSPQKAGCLWSDSN